MRAYDEVRSAGASPDLVFAIVWLLFVVFQLTQGEWYVALLGFIIAVCYLRTVALMVMLDLTRKYALKGWVR